MRISQSMLPRLQQRYFILTARDDGPGGPPTAVFVVIGVVLALIVGAVLATYLLRRRQRGPFSRNTKRGGYEQTNDSESLVPGSSTTGDRSRSRNAPPNFDAANTNRNNATSPAPDRNTSVRSVMTLPAYRHKASETEQVLGREGERDGVDVVVELPTAEEEEALREQEMDALFQIRQTRRRQNAERQERRREAEEARARGDGVALAEINARRRAASNSTEISDLRAEHERLKKHRQRAVSSVSYGDLGVARHDGTRLRANSQESERMGLLSDAASIALSTRSNLHRRDRSSSSVLSFDSNTEVPSPRFPVSGNTTPRMSSQTRAGSSPEIIGEADLGDTEMPPHSPPGYDDVSLDDTRSDTASSMIQEPPPDYPGPTAARDVRLNGRVADMVVNVGGGDSDTASPGNRNTRNSRQSEAPRSSRGVGGIPQLPSLRLHSLPQIVVEPSSAQPGDHQHTGLGIH